jgi:hypothetical protein
MYTKQQDATHKDWKRFVIDPVILKFMIESSSDDNGSMPATLKIIITGFHSFINASTAFCWALASPSVPQSLYTDYRTPWMSDQPVARPLPTHRTTQTQNKRTHRHPCLEWDSNPRSQRSSGRRQFMPHVRPRGHRDRQATGFHFT